MKYRYANGFWHIVDKVLNSKWFDEKGRARLLHPAAYRALRMAYRAERTTGELRARRSREAVQDLRTAAEAKRFRKAMKLRDDSCARDIGYYRVQPGSNAHRFSQHQAGLPY